MQRTITVNLPLEPRLVRTVEVINDATNQILIVGFENKTINKLDLHHLTYYPVREVWPEIPASLVQTARDTASEMLKREKLERLPHKKPHSSIRYDQRTFTPKLGKGYVTISSVEGRVKLPVVIPPYFDKYKDWQVQAARLAVRKTKLVLQLIVEQRTPSVRPPDTVLGVDTGIINHAVLSNNKFYSSAHIRSVKGRYQHNRKVLQAKGTRSARRKLKRLSGREHRFMTDTNHCVANWIVEQPFDAIALEKLEIKRKRGRRGRRQRKFNRQLGNWSFGQLRQFVEYQAENVGKQVVYVDPRGTSQGCSACGNVTKRNRHGRKFKCVKCGFELHADLNAARNIARRGTSATGRPSVNRPLVACDDTVVSGEHSYKPSSEAGSVTPPLQGVVVDYGLATTKADKKPKKKRFPWAGRGRAD